MNNLTLESELKILVFTLDCMSCALNLSKVVRVIHAIEVRNLPKAPEIISGIINIQGQIIPVVNIRKRLNLPEKETDPDDRVIIADTGIRKIALFVDSVEDIRELNQGQFADYRESIPFAGYIKGIAKLENEIILIYDLEQFLSLDEEKDLEIAIGAKKK